MSVTNITEAKSKKHIYFTTEQMLHRNIKFALNKLGGITGLTAKQAARIIKLTKYINDKGPALENSRIALNEKLCKKDKDGKPAPDPKTNQYMFTETNTAILLKEWAAITKGEHQLKVRQISFAVAQRAQLSPLEMEAVSFFIEGMDDALSEDEDGEES